jgi:t-SNARE complex subunit (syntaxin)
MATALGSSDSALRTQLVMRVVMICMMVMVVMIMIAVIMVIPFGVKVWMGDLRKLRDFPYLKYTIEKNQI